MGLLFLNYFQILIIFFSCLAVLVKNPVYSIFFLLLVFLNSACLILLMNFEFLALLFLIVYIGAIIVLFIFVIMMVNIKILDFSVKFFDQIYSILFVIILFWSCYVGLFFFLITYLFFMMKNHSLV